jgi:hypothetical protein
MAKTKTKRRSKSKKGGFGGWGRETIVGGSWLPPTNNTYAQMTSSGARSNHFSLSRHGGMVGGIDPANQGNYGPSPYQINPRVPPLRMGSRGGKRRRRQQTLKQNNKRGKKGGGFLELGGFPAIIETAWNNMTIGARNMANAYNGVRLMPSASGWKQPELAKIHTYPMPTKDWSNLKTAVDNLRIVKS